MAKMLKIFVTITIITVLLIVGLFFIKSRNENKINIDKIDMNQNAQSSFKITSLAFKSGTTIPAKYTCDGDSINPPLNISGVPESAKSLALIVDDPDAPSGTWIHWVAWNIDPKISEISEGIQNVGINGLNTRGNPSYGGPCPPDKEHRYFFKLYALDVNLDIPETSGASDLIKSMEGHIIDQVELIGLYDRKR